MFEVLNSIFPIVFILVIGFILFNILKSVVQWHRNNQQPILYVDATIVSKRTHASALGANKHHGNLRQRSNTSYFATFEFEEGERIELTVSGYDYGMLSEGDKGELSYQGTRYNGFTRRKE
jgi:hypothetical protein